MPAWPATTTALALELAGTVPLLDPRVRDELIQDETTTELVRRLADEPFIRQITMSRADDPRLEDPTVLLFSDESWGAIQKDVGVVAPGERAREFALWHTAVPLANGGYLLTPDPIRPGVVSFYRATRDESEAAFEFRVGTVSRGAYDEIVWEKNDDRCHLIRYFSGKLQCRRVNCTDDCAAEVEIDPKTGAQSMPCGCP
jgi:hypothetical protein